ncbi:phosphotransferase family protein [Halobacillus amylolyticus]|uniref:Aminoglycoside phosphotransferase family protein n=1 Tax=Halobacillus amylolyticus TaxID=2932259 RepID=A0ABY4HFQ0_9BACI|nr:aminoglycoside phosphotransferase family protein [Halobacillus amylolyticus]UOR13750.1 aminoglycoside phosphotransferase family protein [Halobacillus amylolyticus]
MKKEKFYVDRIKQCYPNLHIYSAEMNDSGQNNDVLIANDSLVFRFAKYKEGIDHLKLEIEILNGIYEYVSLPIPRPIYKDFASKEPGRSFMGYERIDGQPFWRNLISTSKNAGHLQGIANQLAQFLNELHSIPVKKVVPTLEKETINPYNEISDLYVDFKIKLFPYMRDEAKRKTSERFEAYLSDGSHFNFTPCLIHGDFGASNILYSSDQNKITGVIDFGGSYLGDPAYDFAGILSSYGEEFLNMLTSHYPGIDHILKRMKFYKSTFALQEALFGIENNDVGAFNNGIREYR